jgi:hypothetical protein
MKRKMTVSYRAQKYFQNAVPFIRIGNRFLKEAGFRIGDKVEVQYLDKEIIIKKLI